MHVHCVSLRHPPLGVPLAWVQQQSEQSSTMKRHQVSRLAKHPNPAQAAAVFENSAIRFASALDRCGAFVRRSQGISSNFSMTTSRRPASSGQRPLSYAEVAEACSVLGVDVDCDGAYLKKVYRNLVQKNHPDAGGDAALMSRITVAYNRLKSLSKLEKEQFKLQKNMYRGGSHYHGNGSDNMNTRYSRGEPSYRTSAGHAAQDSRDKGTTHGFYNTSNTEHFRQSASQSHGFYTYHNRNNSFAENPFSNANPFSMHAQIRRAWNLPVGTLLLRGFVAYLGLSILLLLAYRRYRDWLHDDGWKMAESFARHERLAEIQRMQQEANQRMLAVREAAASIYGGNGGMRPSALRGFDGNSSNDYNVVTTSRDHELRASQDARARRVESNVEIKGWPATAEEKGKLVIRPQCPPGVVFFEPHKEHERQRQLANVHLGRVWSERKESASAAHPLSTVSNSDSIRVTQPEDNDAVKALRKILTAAQSDQQTTKEEAQVKGAT
ncbi:hypothetical protein ERJ75_000753000 [Trypanosoma vivax]|uniref:Putative chaperone protein DNAj n=1 Tax=Trypanosoma vivax (strain Y486) TaxID=1055687 RepID=G0U045_TRYVY|nr:putative chaperone protein DNAj [Trypanosoma vivax]KAH8614257.1 hypothetical protein ERJ75_000753000 [Trypanosoma vivax]CCC49442.1 putative chaperone protein DNAj [Trypanosoma vivax Y486]